MFLPLRPSLSLSVQMKDSAKSAGRCRNELQGVAICIGLPFLSAGYWLSPLRGSFELDVK